MSDTAVIIPVRLASTRLPNKPLALINGKPMVLCVAEQARKANIGDIIIACGDQELFDLVTSNGYQAVLTDPALPSGSDRVYAGMKSLNKKYKYIVNLQGDTPTINPSLIIQLASIIRQKDADIVTAVAPIKSEEENQSPSVVKAILAYDGRALYFSRTPSIPHGDGIRYHHIGIYVYKAEALEKYVTLPPSPLELREKLEQLRALENGMTIYAAIVDEAPKGVDTPEDLEAIRKASA